MVLIRGNKYYCSCFVFMLIQRDLTNEKMSYQSAVWTFKIIKVNWAVQLLNFVPMQLKKFSTIASNLYVNYRSCVSVKIKKCKEVENGASNTLLQIYLQNILICKRVQLSEFWCCISILTAWQAVSRNSFY